MILKESTDAKDYLQKLQDLLPKASGEVKEKIEKEIAIVNAGIFGEDNILFELKNSGMDLAVIQDLYIKTKSGLSAQIDFFVVAPKCFYIIECKNLFGNIEINNNGDFIRLREYTAGANENQLPDRQSSLNTYAQKIIKEKNMLVNKPIVKKQSIWEKIKNVLF